MAKEVLQQERRDKKVLAAVRKVAQAKAREEKEAARKRKRDAELVAARARFGDFVEHGMDAVKGPGVNTRKSYTVTFWRCTAPRPPSARALSRRPISRNL